MRGLRVYIGGGIYHHLCNVYIQVGLVIMELWLPLNFFFVLANHMTSSQSGLPILLTSQYMYFKSHRVLFSKTGRESMLSLPVLHSSLSPYIACACPVCSFMNSIISSSLHESSLIYSYVVRREGSLVPRPFSMRYTCISLGTGLERRYPDLFGWSLACGAVAPLAPLLHHCSCMCIKTLRPG